MNQSFKEMVKWGERRIKNKIEWGHYVDLKTGKTVDSEIRGGKHGVRFGDKGKNIGTVHTHPIEGGMTPPSAADIITSRCVKAPEHYVVADGEIWVIKATDSFGMMGKLTQVDVQEAHIKAVFDAKEKVKQLMADGKIGLDETSIKQATDKEIGDAILKEFSKPEWKKKNVIIRRAYRHV